MDDPTPHPSGRAEATLTSKWATTGFNYLRLQYGDTVIGDLTNVFMGDGTWYGDFRPTLTGPSHTTEQRILEYIKFCRDWVARSYAEADADASEFDQFGDLLSSGIWRTRSPDGTIGVISHAPVFRDDEVSWVYLPPESGEQDP